MGNVVVGGGCAKWTPVGLPRQNRVLCVGRICEEAHGGRLNQASVQLEGSRGHSMGSTIALDLSGLLRNDGGDVGDRGNREYGYSLFPGQIVAVEGINPSGRTMRVTRVIEGVEETNDADGRRAWVDVDIDVSPMGPYDRVVRCGGCKAGLRVHTEAGLVA